MPTRRCDERFQAGRGDPHRADLGRCRSSPNTHLSKSLKALGSSEHPQTPPASATPRSTPPAAYPGSRHRRRSNAPSHRGCMWGWWTVLRGKAKPGLGRRPRGPPASGAMPDQPAARSGLERPSRERIIAFESIPLVLRPPNGEMFCGKCPTDLVPAGRDAANASSLLTRESGIPAFRGGTYRSVIAVARPPVGQTKVRRIRFYCSRAHKNRIMIPRLSSATLLRKD